MEDTQRVQQVWKCTNCRLHVAVFTGHITADNKRCGGSYGILRSFTQLGGALYCEECFYKARPDAWFVRSGVEVLETVRPATTTIKGNASGGCSDMPVEREDHSIFTTLEQRGILSSAEYAVDVFLACAEAERQVNEWLDVLRNKHARKAKKEEARMLLQQHAAEYGWLRERWREVEQMLDAYKSVEATV